MFQPRSKFVLAALAGMLSLGAPGALAAAPPPLRVAVAASARDALGAIAAAYRQHGGGPVTIVSGASGTFFAQIAQGAPFDAFFSADAGYPTKLEAQGLASDRMRYARGRIVLWVPRGSTLALKAGLAALKAPAVQHVAIANPAIAPYGRAAASALANAHLAAAIAPKLVLGNDVAQAAQFVETGAAEAGLLSLSLAKASPLAREGRYVPIPTTLYAPIVADAVVVKSSAHAEAARAFLRFVTGPVGRAILRRDGLAPDAP